MYTGKDIGDNASYYHRTAAREGNGGVDCVQAPWILPTMYVEAPKITRPIIYYPEADNALESLQRVVHTVKGWIGGTRENQIADIHAVKAYLDKLEVSL